jgi:hypothetical protein
MTALPNADDPNRLDRPRRTLSDLRRARPGRATPLPREDIDVSADDDEAGYAPTPEEQELQRQLRRRRSSLPGFLIAGAAGLVLAGGLAYFTLGRDDNTAPAPVPEQRTASAPVQAEPPAEPAREPGPAPSDEPREPAQASAEPPPQRRAAPAEPEAAAPTPAAPPTAPAVPAPAPAPRVAAPAPAEIAGLLKRARELIEVGDIGAARLLLDRAASGNDGAALFALAETYDPAMLAQWRVRGVRPDVGRARAFYQRALDRGVAQAQERLAGLR